MNPQADSNTTMQSSTKTPMKARVGFDGILAGTFGAMTLLLWFLIVDLIEGKPLYMPDALANLFLGVQEGLQTPGMHQTTLEIIWGNIWIHWLVFVALGGVVSWLLGVTERNPNIGFGVVLLITICGALAMGFVTVFTTEVLHLLSWPIVFIGHLLAAAAMTVYFWHRHRHLQFYL